MKKSFARQASLEKKARSMSSTKDQSMESQDSQMLDRIMSKRKKMSDGGVASNETTVVADELPNEFDDLVLDDNLEANYVGDTQLGSSQEDKDREDMVSRIARQRKMKQSNPKPA